MQRQMDIKYINIIIQNRTPCISCCCDLKRRNFMEERLVWTLGRLVKPIMVWKIWQREIEAVTLCLQSRRREDKKCAKPQTPKPVTSFFQGDSTSESFYNLSEEHQPLGPSVQTQEPTGDIFYLIYNKLSRTQREIPVVCRARDAAALTSHS